MRVPITGQPLFERRIVREGKRIAERMLDGYAVTGNGRFVPHSLARDWGRGDGRPRSSTGSG
ncbi:hypothetical protein O9Z70_08540 [Devosia sp. YIM 151766]|uniref:hypothetical protein n=1 Tax=Devosia sp. YIM 151766 TaxID=3017325 RepID=UPI00255C7933|nr:hypothetical protein [Devosia sp. YIM 151766]WIY51540.1 hypothetical protein O9Z70_08540 [Devosia sp. YIM 151766]